jgi:hypothetical protein
LVKASNLPKQFGFEVQVQNLHYDEKKPILAKNLVQGRTFISKLFFVFNINDILLHDNQEYHLQSSYGGNQQQLLEALDSSQQYYDFDGAFEKAPLHNYEAFSESCISRELFADSE